MDKASDFESEDWGFDPHHGRLFLIHSSLEHIVTAQLRRMVSHGPLESTVRTILTVFRKHLRTYIVYLQRHDNIRPCGPMDKASDFESEDCGFDPHHGRLFLIHSSLEHIVDCTTEANGKSWTIGIHGSYCFDCISETFGNIYCIFTMTG